MMIHFEYAFIAHRTVMRARRFGRDAFFAYAYRIKHSILRRQAGMCGHSHVIMEHYVEQQPIADNHKADGHRRASLPPEWQANPMGDVDNSRSQSAHRYYEELRGLNAKNTKNMNILVHLFVNRISLIIYRSEQMHVVINNPEYRLHSHVECIILAHVMVVGERAPTCLQIGKLTCYRPTVVVVKSESNQLISILVAL